MSTAPLRNPALRVKLPCADERDFYARLADPIAEKGLRVPTANLRPVGSRVRLVLEFRNAETVSGEGVVDAHLEGARPSMNVRLLRFERPRSAEGRAPPPAPPPAPAAAAARPAPVEQEPAPVPERPAAPEPAAPEPAAPETSFASLFDEEPGPHPQPAAGPDAAEPPQATAAPESAAPAGRPPIEGTAELPLLYEVPPQTQARSASRASSLPPASRRTALAALAAGVVLVLGILGYAVVRRPASPAPPPRAPVAAAASDAPVAARLGVADQRMSEGRLTGPDGALDHLLAARTLAPDDARVTERLALLADTLEKLGARALERGDVAEAEVHLAAALQAAPDRQSIAAKLEELGKVPQREARPRRPDETQAQRQ